MKNIFINLDIQIDKYILKTLEYYLTNIIENKLYYNLSDDDYYDTKVILATVKKDEDFDSLLTDFKKSELIENKDNKTIDNI